MAYKSANETTPHTPLTSIPVSPFLNSDDVAFNYLTKLVVSMYRPIVEPVVLMGRYENQSEGFEKFRVSVVGWKSSEDHTVEKFLIPPQEGTTRQSALLAVVRLLENKAHERMADLEAKGAEAI